MNNAGNDLEIAEVRRPDVERAIWELTGYTGDAVAVDALMLVIDTYAAGMAEAIAGVPVTRRSDLYHVLVTYAAELIDSGGRMRLVPKGDALIAAVQRVKDEVPMQPARPKLEPAPPGYIRCRLCLEAKPADLFALDRTKSTGHKSACKACISAQRAAKQAVSVPA